MITNEIMQMVEEIKSDILLYADDWLFGEECVKAEVYDEVDYILVETSFEIWHRVVNLSFKLYRNHKHAYILYGPDLDDSVNFNHAMFWRTVAMEMCDE